MLSQKTIDIVKSTAPILYDQGETLIKHFYKRMFLHNPEVIPLFNHANQRKGTQQKALARAIVAYAESIDNLDALSDAVETIAQKHVSLQIKPEHYPIVGENLLESLKEVLGDGATDEVIEAWREAYGLLADILQGREKQIYDENASKPGGWENFRKFRVDRKEKESSIITSFYLKPEDGGAVPEHLAGQSITIRVPTSDGSTTMRNYSLSDKPNQDYFRISVKREDGAKTDIPKGYVSNKLHNEIEVGDLLEVAPPCGEFFLDINDQHKRPLVLLAAGIGVTPILSILLTALDSMPDRPIIFLHGCINKEVQAFKNTIDQLAEEHPNLTVRYCYSRPTKNGGTRESNTSTDAYVTTKLIKSLTSSRDADYYFCGPEPFIISIYYGLANWSIPGSQIHFEFFGPKREIEGPCIIIEEDQ